MLRSGDEREPQEGGLRRRSLRQLPGGSYRSWYERGCALDTSGREAWDDERAS